MYNKHYTNSDYALNLLPMTMVSRIELRIFHQIVTSFSFGPKTKIPSSQNAESLKTIVCQTAPLAKLQPGGSYLLMKYDVFRQNADIF